MTHPRFNVIIIGAGPAGVTAAGALAGTGLSVALLEAAVYAGAENWSGCVYFTESLAARDCFGPDAVASAPFERRVVRRGTLLHNGLDVVGLELSDRDAFRDCYTVLRPVYDPYFADLARVKGAVHLTGTTVTSLIRNRGAVIGVETNRGPLYADVTFLAEGDASHLVHSEEFEQVRHPHFLQGVKAVLSLGAGEIEKRFGLGPEEGAAYELLLRNPAIGGRTAQLNIGAFLYTNRDSISLGYVAPLENIRDNFRGSHDRVYEWLSGLPYIRELIQGAELSAYGTKLIRSGGTREQPLLVLDGLAVGGAATGLGTDIPFPNFTGPASASGLFFARAVKSIVKSGGSFDAARLSREYVAPLRESVYGKNADYLSHWPAYFGRSRVLFGRTVDVACGTTHFLSRGGSLAETGRFLRGHVLSPKGLRELVTDTCHAFSSLRLWNPLLKTLMTPSTLWRWTVNPFTKTAARERKLGLILRINGSDLRPEAFSWPVNSLLKRLSLRLEPALAEVYANDGQPLDRKFARALGIAIRGLSLGDLVVLPLYGLTLFVIALGTAAVDAFRFYLLKTPVEKMLAQPSMAYAEKQKKARDLELVRPGSSLEAKLAANSYRVGRESHIRTAWPERIPDHPDMADAGLWWVCPARVYVYEAPQFSGRGRVTVNYENCIKCESCWRAEPLRALWGRHTEHKLIYRPETAAMQVLLEALKHDAAAPLQEKPLAHTRTSDDRSLPFDTGVRNAAAAALNASRAFNDCVRKLPASADHTRLAWAASLGKRLTLMLSRLEAGTTDTLAAMVRSEREALERRLAGGRLFHALYCGSRIEECLRAFVPDAAANAQESRSNERAGVSHEAVSALFPDRIVKQWEDSPIPEAWRRKLQEFIVEHRDNAAEAVRALSSVSPALGLIAARRMPAFRFEKECDGGTCAIDGDLLALEDTAEGARITGKVQLVPLAGSHSLLVRAKGKGYRIALSSPGLSIKPTPAIGFRAAGLAEISFDCQVPAEPLSMTGGVNGDDAFLYLSIALGAADYLSMRVKEHASGRVQFGGQMLDTEGRDGIAKLGAVKALIARVEAWRLMLQSLYDSAVHSPFRIPHSALPFDLVYSALAARAFGPEPGSMGYDAGQVFGGFAYSEDDLLSRFYRDSSLFRFLWPGHGAPARLNRFLEGQRLGRFFPEPLPAAESEPLGRIVARYEVRVRECSVLPPGCDPGLAGEAKALLAGIEALLLAAEETLERGMSSEPEAAACEVLLSLAEEAVVKARLSSGRGHVSPSAVFPLEPVVSPVAKADYEAFCTAPGEPHQSGSFLVRAFDRSARFIPEMQLADPKLADRWRSLAGWFRTNCGEKRFDGLEIERFIERKHRLPDEIIQAAKDNRWLATYVPRSLDGLGWHKAEYYILNAVAGSFGDASIDLLIMASTSIGTTPILLGLEEELPRVQEELAPLAAGEGKLGVIGLRLDGMIRTFSSPSPAWIRKEYEAIMKLVDERIRHTRVVKYLAANFLKAFYGAGLAGRRGDFAGFMENLKHARELFSAVMPDVRAALDELPRREACHKLFLRALGHGGVSAFALTEPTAGSDSGGVKTTARLLRSPLAALEDGRYSFSPDGSEKQSVRYLIDAAKIVFTESGMAYSTPDGNVQPIRHDRYDYTQDQGVRFFIYEGKECAFHDIGQVRRSPKGAIYEYYSLAGAKMWITNGSIATQFCLYARTPEGVTGLLVDRHAEGLKVGADEKKTGQRGSPTNEISLDRVRVPREAVIGYEGHGQVNALETLNVGRCGLAVVSGALMRKLMREANELIPASPERDRLLGEAAAILFSSESLAYYLVGLFDRAHESVRMESAIAKYVCSEDIHELITLLEQAFGPEGQTEHFLLEKARRDSRILTIYEGTNEVQRFLILKDLMTRAENWPEVAAAAAGEADSALASWKNRLRDLAREARDLLGDTSWSDAMLQPALFPLSEMAGEILRLECIWYRMERLNANSDYSEEQSAGYRERMLAAGRRGLERSLVRLEHLSNRALAGLMQIRNNLTMPEVRLADAALDALERKNAVPERSVIPLQARLRLLCIVRPVADLSPRPRLRQGQLRELVWKIDPSDQAALSQALALKSASAGRVIVDVLMPGGAEHEQLLRMAAGSGPDDLHRLPVAPDASPREYVKCILDLEVMQQYQAIVTGATSRNGDQCLGAYIAGRLKRYHYRRDRIEVKPDGSGLVHLAPPAVVSITETAVEPVLTMTDLLEAQHLRIKIVKTGAAAGSSVFEAPSAAQAESPPARTPGEAAGFLKAFAAAASGGRAEDYTAEPGTGPIFQGDAAWAILEPGDQKQNLALLRGCALAARLAGKDVHAVIAAPRSHWPRLLGVVRSQGCAAAWCLDTAAGRLSKDGRRSLLRLLLGTSDTAIVFSPAEWTSTTAYVAGESEAAQNLFFCSGITEIGSRDDALLTFSQPCYDGRLMRTHGYAGGQALITIAPEADFPASAARREFSARVLDIEINPGWTMPLPPPALPTLTQADVIIDLGYGVKDSSGLKLAQELKERLETLGLAPLFGATRKVTQDLKLLPLEAQIGQTGVRVNPKLVIALGISGAPQHLDYLGTRAQVLCFNRDSEAPLMQLNRSRPSPRVHPILGDLFITIRELLEELK